MDPNTHREENRRIDTGIHESQALHEMEMTETEIIHRAKQRDAAAFERLYQLHSRRVYALCLRMLRNASEAEDLTQEAFLQLFRKIHTFRGESAFSTWLHRIAVNLVLMRLRRKARQEVSWDDSEEFSVIGISGAIGCAELSLRGSIDRACLVNAIERLSPSYKMSIELHDFQGYKHTEIAKIMDCSVGTSKAQLHRARKKLRELVRGKLGSGWYTPTARQMPLTASS